MWHEKSTQNAKAETYNDIAVKILVWLYLLKHYVTLENKNERQRLRERIRARWTKEESGMLNECSQFSSDQPVKLFLCWLMVALYLNVFRYPSSPSSFLHNSFAISCFYLCVCFGSFFFFLFLHRLGVRLFSLSLFTLVEHFR